MKKIRALVRGRHRPLTIVLFVLIGLIASIIVLGFIPFSNATLKNKAEQLLKESLSGQCTIGKLDITLWKGVIVHDVRYRSYNQENGVVRLSCTFPRITLSYYLIPLFFKHLIINDISFEKPDIGIDWPAPDVRKKSRTEAFSFAALSRVIATLPYTVLVRNISIVNAHAIAGQSGRSFFIGKGMGLSMKVGLKRELTLDGRLEAIEVKLFGNCRLTGCKASVRVKGTAVSLYDCRAALYGGALSVKGFADLSEGLLRSLMISLTELKLNEWYHETGAGVGDVTGKMNASLDFDKSELSVDSLRGKGWIKATAVSARGTSLQKNLVLRLAIPKIETMKFNTIYADCSMKNGKVYTRNFYGKGDPMDFTADGWVDLNGRFSERIEGVFSADFSRSLPDIVRNSLLPVEGNQEKRSFKGIVAGTFDNPQLEVDQRIVKRAVNNVFDVIGRSLGNLFKK